MFPKIDIVGFESRGHVRKSQNHEHEGFEVFSKNEIAKLLVRNEAE